MLRNESAESLDPQARAVSTVRALAEAAFDSGFADNPHAQAFQGALSTCPFRTTVTSEALMGKCGILAGELQRALSDTGLPTEMCISEDRQTTWHRSLRTVVDGVEVIIDPSIGQYVAGHNHVFVGTRAQLKQLILSPSTRLIHTNIADKGGFFQRTWGNKGQKVRN